MMRAGRLLTEDSPQYLLMKHNRTSLEDVFLSLCVKSEIQSSPATTVEEGEKRTAKMFLRFRSNKKEIVFEDQEPHLKVELTKVLHEYPYYQIFSSLFIHVIYNFTDNQNNRPR